VILGAGHDSFAYRHPELAASVQIVEIDRPATQSWKQQRLFELGIQQPSNLVFLPLDLNVQSLLDGFRVRGDTTRQQPAFLSWLGVTQYLAEDVVFRILQQVAFLAPGSEIVFTYIVPRQTLDRENQRLLTIFTRSVGARGEPWVTFFETARLTRKLQELGFTQIKNLRPEEANARYFAGRTDALSVPGLEHVMRARVG